MKYGRVRGKITEVGTESNVEVFLMDYGETKTYDINSVKSVVGDSCRLEPQLAYLCSLPVERVGEEWAEDCVYYLFQLYESQDDVIAVPYLIVCQDIISYTHSFGFHL